MIEQDFPREEYVGSAVLSARADRPVVEVRAPASLETPRVEDGIPVEVTLRGHFEPLDGRYHWYGRVAADDEVTACYPPGSAVLVTTPHGRAEGRLSDLDPWGRFRISGTGRPPY